MVGASRPGPAAASATSVHRASAPPAAREALEAQAAKAWPTRPHRRPATGVCAAAARPVDASRLEAAAWDALRVDDASEAESLLLEATGRGGVSPHLTASVAAAQGRSGEAVRLFVLAFGVAETPPNLVVARVIAKAGIAVPLAEALLDDPTVEVDATAQLQNHLHFAGAFRDAAQVGERLVSDGRRSVAQSCYEVACSWSKAGDPEAGLAWLNRAVESGFRAPRLIEGEDDLAAVRALPGYVALHRSLHDG